MARFLISFPSAAMSVAPQELAAVSEAAHAVVREAKEAGVWVFGGAINAAVAPVMVDGDGSARPGAYPQTAAIQGGYAIFELPSRQAALHWAAKLATACRCPQEVREFHPDPES